MENSGMLVAKENAVTCCVTRIVTPRTVPSSEPITAKELLRRMLNELLFRKSRATIEPPKKKLTKLIKSIEVIGYYLSPVKSQE